MIPNAILAISSGGRRRASLSGTSEPSTRNIGGRPALRWMSEAPPRRATCRISFSSIVFSAPCEGSTLAERIRLSLGRAGRWEAHGGRRRDGRTAGPLGSARSALLRLLRDELVLRLL